MNTSAHSTKNPTLGKPNTSENRTIDAVRRGFGLDRFDCITFPSIWFQYPAQVCRIGMLYHWTRECDLGIAEIKYDRKALQGTLKKYVSTVSKLSSVLARGQWKSAEEPMLPLHKNRLECMITVRSGGCHLQEYN